MKTKDRGHYNKRYNRIIFRFTNHKTKEFYIGKCCIPLSSKTKEDVIKNILPSYEWIVELFDYDVDNLEFELLEEHCDHEFIGKTRERYAIEGYKNKYTRKQY